MINSKEIVAGRYRCILSNVYGSCMGWNTVSLKAPSLIMNGIPDNSFFYFMHSYYVPENEFTIMETEYGNRFSSGIGEGNIYGVQFHPEKSGENGVRVLKNFGGLK